MIHPPPGSAAADPRRFPAHLLGALWNRHVYVGLQYDLWRYVFFIGLATLLELLLFVLLVRGLGVHALVAHPITYVFGVALTYYLMFRAIFTTRKAWGLQALALYLVTVVLGLLFSQGIVYLAVVVARWPALAGKIIAIGATVLFNFFLRRAWLISTPRPTP